ncbi:hypothetical protein M427DRAFT_30793 [Gonapodya prolifera JEL478]|uniref:WD40 repeat-like protein n=1 Tax=Gonapodya prolifera (strain JEL478) TaxID=1344416 RepID=A0A139AJJ0_GONPJ|nr:hypothetical protein M427DRAFT_30793 [Gonapodya prolifera JEL478]|eukprot:KXS16970.1 hypothetical protein M427DRAFT_30793 [Gonapodya prolifera JEL478]
MSRPTSSPPKAVALCSTTGLILLCSSVLPPTSKTASGTRAGSTWRIDKDVSSAHRSAMGWSSVGAAPAPGMPGGTGRIHHSVTSLSFNPSSLLACHTSKILHIRPLPSSSTSTPTTLLKPTSFPAVSAPHIISSCDWHSTLDLTATAGTDAKWRVRDADGRGVAATPTAIEGGYEVVKCAPNGTCPAAGGWGWAGVAGMTGWHLTNVLLRRTPTSVLHLSWHPTSSHLALACSDGRVVATNVYARQVRWRHLEARQEDPQKVVQDLPTPLSIFRLRHKRLVAIVRADSNTSPLGAKCYAYAEGSWNTLAVVDMPSGVKGAIKSRDSFALVSTTPSATVHVFSRDGRPQCIVKLPSAAGAGAEIEEEGVALGGGIVAVAESPMQPLKTSPGFVDHNSDKLSINGTEERKGDVALVRGEVEEAAELYERAGMRARAVRVWVEAYQWALEIAAKHNAYFDFILVHRQKYVAAMGRQETDKVFLDLQERIKELDVKEVKRKHQEVEEKERISVPVGGRASGIAR